ncbi:MULTISPECIES: anthranilate synthase component I [unclassified Coleofasciculus]|uniref:anthranilate synthase component I n=1 Tax=unclassified Coleofasciculus TaxID=2692782 RepID=UPI00187F77B3|nr:MULTISPECIES: anthranilate synthase component I [unclassified Coleofasciculus]MBE9124705.1 anthranilate synthase component I [Coleofasciculus sp. LEGE 07081]MBE9147032.1 anthranilate synthase component I [Coleofasciculus sp. LEGE 07092]
MTKLQPWHWRSLPLENRTGSEIFEKLFLNSGAIATLLESPYPTPQDQPQLAQYSICAGMPRLLQGHPRIWTPPVGKIMPLLRRLLSSQADQEPLNPPLHLPFTGGWLGWLGYDLAWEIERLPYTKPDPLPFPVAFWYEPAAFAVLDHCQQVLWLAATSDAQLNQLHQHLEAPSPSFHLPSVRLSVSALSLPKGHAEVSPSPHPPLTFLTSQADYEAAVVQAKKYIQAGDIFQANLSLRFEATTSANSWAIYRTLQQINPSPFASYWHTPWGDVISCSPERLVQLQGRTAQTRPIAGTRSRSATPETDRQLAQDLLANAKERAEHIMLVDLERNDLGRVCEWGSVRVSELLAIERYSHVMHLVSNITGTLRAECDAVELIRALFPGGTITGCPKVRCLEIIEELEPMRRSLFYGSCGYLDWRGNLDLNILIRTLLFKIDEAVLNSRNHPLNSSPSAINSVWGQVGAGIVADSEPEKEWYESLYKAQAQLAAIQAVSY